MCYHEAKHSSLPRRAFPLCGRSSVNYWHRLSADNTSWGTAVVFHRNPIAEKKFTVDVPRGQRDLRNHGS